MARSPFAATIDRLQQVAPKKTTKKPTSTVNGTVIGSATTKKPTSTTKTKTTKAKQ